MALQTKTFSSPTTSNGFTLTLTLEENSTDVLANTSSVTYTLVLKSGAWHFSQYRLGAKIVLGGTVVASRDKETAPQVSLSANSSLTILSGTTTIAHNTDGTKTLSVAFSIDMAKDSYAPGPIDVTGQSMTMTIIPRASTIGATDANIGAVSMIAVNKKSSTYTHSIAYNFGSLSGYITSSGHISSTEVKFSATSVSFTVSKGFYTQIPNAKTGVCTLTCKTYSGTTQIGNAQTCTFTATAAEANCKPTVSGAVVDSNDVTKALTGDENKLVRYYSTALCTITATAKNHATISSKTIGGATVSGTTRTISNVESGCVTFAAKDSRGYSASATVNSTMIPYVKLTNNAVGTRTEPTTGNAKLTIKGDYFNGSFGAVNNALTAKWRSSGGTYVTVTPTISGNTYLAEVELSGLDYTQTYTYEVVVSDKLASVTKTVTIGNGVPVFDWGENDVNFHVPIKLGDTQLTETQLQQLTTPITYGDYIVERGVSGSWTYHKYASGDVVMAYGGNITFPGEDSIVESWLNGFYIVYTDITLPVALVDAHCAVTASINWYDSEWVQTATLNKNKIRIRKYANVDGLNKTNNYVSIIVHGRWK